jgi:hypothetical protein
LKRVAVAFFFLAAASHRTLGSAPPYGDLPLAFEANAGQTDPRVRFLARGAGYRLFLTPEEAVFVFAPEPSGDAAVVHLKLPGARPGAKAVGVDALPGNANYFLGNDPKKWRTNVPTYRAVRFESVWRGIDLVYYGNGRQLEYDFVVRPGARPDAIRMALPQAARLSTDPDGDLVVDTPRGTFGLKRPLVYQTIAGRRVPIAGEYVVGPENHVAFRVAAYDHTRPLVIDPVLNYATFLGGSDVDAAFGIAVDSAGSAYVIGRTFSTDFPTQGALQSANAGAPAGAPNVFVAKLSPAGNALVYSTYLGGSGDDRGYGIAVDVLGNAYICGRTLSTNFPTQNPLQSSNSGDSDAFVAKLSAAGNSLVYSTYLGGGLTEYAFAIAVDGSGSAYVTGQTSSPDFPFKGTPGPFQKSLAGGIDAFVSKLTPAGNALVYSTYLGGTGDDIGHGIAVDDSSNAYVTGETASTNFPTQGPFQAANVGGVDAFVTKLSAAGDTLVYSTYLGGTGDDIGYAIAVSGGSAYVTGNTSSTDFKTQGALQGANGGALDAFVTKLSAAGSSLVYSTYLGGSADETGFGIAVDAAGNATVGGQTLSTDFVTTNAYQASSGGGSDAFITKLSADGNSRIVSTYLGGSLDDLARALAQDSSGQIYVAGLTNSADFPVRSAAQAVKGASLDAFVARICGSAGPTAAVSGGGPICPGGSAAIQAALTGTGPWDIVWSDGFTQPGVPTSPATRSVSPGAATTYTITQVNDSLCYGSASGSAAVTLKPNDLDPSAAAITAPASLCANGSGTASVPDSGPGTTYSWTIVNGTITGGGTTRTVSFTSGPTGPLVLMVTVGRSCGTVSSSTSPTLIPGPPMPVVTGSAGAFAGDTGLVASVENHAGSTYAWTIANGTITSGASSSTVTFTAGLPGTVTLTCVETSALGCNSPPAVFTVPVAGVGTVTEMIPIVLDVPGVNGSRFASEMTLTNPGPTTSNVTLTFTAADALGGTGSGTATETLGPGRQLVVPDVLSYLSGKGLGRSPLVAFGGGTLRVAFGSLVSNGTGFAGTRTTSPSGPGRAGFASSAPVVPGAAPARVALYGLRQNAADRSNLALLNAGTGAPVTLRVTLLSGDAGDGRTLVLPPVTLAPAQWIQLNSVLDRAGFTNGWALVERVSGTDPFLAYAVINDNVTNDGSYVPSVPANRLGGNQALPSIVEMGAFTSELVLTNPSAKSSKVTLIFVESLAHPSGLSTGTIVDTLAPGEQRIIPNAVDFLRSRGAAIGSKGADSYGGSLLVQLSQNGFPVDGFAGVRTSTPAPGGGRYGLFAAAVTVPEAASSGAWVFGLQQNLSTRANLALLNASERGGPVTLQYEIWNGDTGTKAGTSDPIVLTPGKWLQINGVLSGFGVSNGWAKIVRLSGTAGWAAYGVLNDGATPGAGTGDGSYVGMTLFP